MSIYTKHNSVYGWIALFLVVLTAGVIWFVGASEADQPQAGQLDGSLTSTEVIAISGGTAQLMEKEPEVKPDGNIYTQIKLFDRIAWQINSLYMENVDSRELIHSGIKGMLQTLDPFSAVLEKQNYDRLMESTHGKYEGVGMQIDSRDNYIVVMSPLEGTPAYKMGIQAGDRITEINGQSTYDMTTDDAAKLMRGKKGTTVVLTIQREGITTPLEYTLTRDLITIKSVPFYGVTPEKVGYVRLSTFSDKAGQELKVAVTELKERNVEGLILDLRSNGGGLLDQAVEVAGLFLGNDKLVVYTQGRSPVDRKEYLSHGLANFPENLPLVVLVDGATASASEIVSGAIQDWDRGLIIGSTTYGKGLVQQVYDMDADIHLKLTTAKYYTPSGRYIQKPERAKRVPSDLAAQEGEEEESGEAAQIEKVDDKPTEDVFYTFGGRKVYGGGGIKPDIEVKATELNALMVNLFRRQVAFDFAVSYTAGKQIPENFEVGDDVLKEFKKYLKDKEFDYQTRTQTYLDSIKTLAEKDGKQSIYGELLKNSEPLLTREKDFEFEYAKEEIRKMLKQAILSKVYGERGAYEGVTLKDDPDVRKAVEIIRNQKQYQALLQT
ncbi:MAG: S41 family peptidase [candidate division Zixibacteria bacterium]|nr:S41 family peptidase [candidate division Zixibacteria bacterium]